MSDREQILVVEDEQPIADSIALNLREEGYEVTTALRGDDGLRLATSEPYDLILLDLMLPGMDGRDVCRSIRRRRQHTPILMLSARGREADKVLGFELGADDYLAKPFGMLELIARVKALIRRSRQAQEEEATAEEEYATAGVSMNVPRRRVLVDGAQVELRPKEFELLRVLIRNRGRVVVRDRLLDLVWGEDEYMDRGTLDVHIRWLRQKLEKDPSKPERILTVRGVGYRFADSTA